MVPFSSLALSVSQPSSRPTESLSQSLVSRSTTLSLSSLSLDGYLLDAGSLFNLISSSILTQIRETVLSDRMASDPVDGTRFQTEDYETLVSTTDVELLKRAWRNEKAAPEILPYEASLIGRIREQIQLMEETVEEFSRSGIDPLTVSLYQMDLDRTQFLLRSYIRIRMQKIEKHMVHILKTDELCRRLSEEEKIFAERCHYDMTIHLQESVLSKLPNNYQSILRQSIISEEDDMVPQPPLDTFVVCKSREYLQHIQLEDEDERTSNKLEEPFEMEADVLHIIRYKPIKALVESGKIDLL